VTPRLPTVVPFALLATVWGCSFALIAVALRSFAPGQVSSGRIVVGALTLLAISAVTRTPLPRGLTVWRDLAVVGLLLCVVPFWLFAFAEQHVTSALASILNATTPLMTAGVAALLLTQERADLRRLFALLLGLLGVLLVAAPWQASLGGDLLGVLACLAATFCYGTAFVYLRRRVSPLGLAPLTLATGQVVAAGVLTGLVGPWVATGPVRWQAGPAVALVALGALGSGLAYVWNARIVADWGATRASAVTYLTPVVGVAVGVAVLGERTGWHQLAGGLLVLVGVLLAAPGGLAARWRRPGQSASWPTSLSRSRSI
jgi:drug/metabolite transporter (DMT)-like permease